MDLKGPSVVMAIPRRLSWSFWMVARPSHTWYEPTVATAITCKAAASTP